LVTVEDFFFLGGNMFGTLFFLLEQLGHFAVLQLAEEGLVHVKTFSRVELRLGEQGKFYSCILTVEN
jgi:hypothetical protein